MRQINRPEAETLATMYNWLSPFGRVTLEVSFGTIVETRDKLFLFKSGELVPRELEQQVFRDFDSGPSDSQSETQVSAA